MDEFIQCVLNIVVEIKFQTLNSSNKVAWPSGLRRWFKAPVSSEAWVRIPPLPNNFSQKVERGHTDLNHGPIGLQPIALPLSYIPNVEFISVQV